MKNLIILSLSLLLAACASEPRVKVYGIVPNKTVVVAQVCFKEKSATPESVRYSILVKNKNFIRFSETEKINDYTYFTVPLIEKRQMLAFFLPFNYLPPQNLGFMWDMKDIDVSSSKWTTWKEPAYTVQDISDTDFKKNNGLIGKKEKEENEISPYLVRFKQMHLDDYIQDRVTKWQKDPIIPCVISEGQTHQK